MTTQVVRLFVEDVELVHELSGMPDAATFATKAHVALRSTLAEVPGVDVATLRRVLREELDDREVGP